VCLMQLSTRDEDVVIDALALRSQLGAYLMVDNRPWPCLTCAMHNWLHCMPCALALHA
jgi:hypothetical protein